MNQLTKRFYPEHNSDHGLWQKFNQKGIVLFGHSIPRYAVSIAVSVAVHVLVIASYMGISALQGSDVLEIREITFLDLTEQPTKKPEPESPESKTTLAARRYVSILLFSCYYPFEIMERNHDAPLPILQIISHRKDPRRMAVLFRTL